VKSLSSLLSRGAIALGRIRLGEVVGVVIIIEGAVEGLLEDGLGLVDLELALQIAHMVGDGAAVGAATGVGEAELLIRNIVTKGTPIASATAILLHLLWIGISMSTLCKEARKVLRWGSGAVGEALVVTVVGLVGASHIEDSRLDG
jgi:hypothetical protein